MQMWHLGKIAQALTGPKLKSHTCFQTNYLVSPPRRRQDHWQAGQLSGQLLSWSSGAFENVARPE